MHTVRRNWHLPAALMLTTLVLPRTYAQESQPADKPASAAASSQPATSPADADAAGQKKRTVYRTKAKSARPKSDPPPYVKPMSKHAERYGVEAWKKLDWLDFGLEHRTRFELRDDYYLRGDPENDDEQFLLHTDVYIGVREIFDPFRFAIELRDARQFMSDFPEDTRDVNENDILQAFGELYFKDALGEGYPVRFRAGRMTLDLVDRKLIARNNWRNTSDAHDGFRLTLGDVNTDWQIDAFATMLVEIRQTQLDRSNEEDWFFGVVGAWRRWSQYVTLEPYYIVRDQDRKNPARADRTIHTLGLHAFGPIAQSGFDYDVDAAFQFGEDGRRDHRAFAAYGELGYTFAHDWKPRLSFATSYASGDRNPNDNISERFDRLRNPRHPPSMSDLFRWENTISPRLRLAFQPHKDWRVETGYGAHWLASDSDAWPIPGRRDPLGRSGDFVGQDFDIRIRYQINENTELDAGYSHFMPGDFVQNTGPADDSDFFYVALTFDF